MNSGDLKAKKFFIDKVLLQAQKEHVILSEAERYMLSWTEDRGKDFSPNQDLTDKFEDEITQDAFEKKIAGLLCNAYVNDAQNDKQQKKTYQDALRALREGDHYIAVMAEMAIKEGGAANWLKDKILLIVAAVGVSICLFVFLDTLDKLSIEQWSGFILGTLIYLGAIYSFSFKMPGRKNHAVYDWQCWF